MSRLFPPSSPATRVVPVALTAQNGRFKICVELPERDGGRGTIEGPSVPHPVIIMLSDGMASVSRSASGAKHLPGGDRRRHFAAHDDLARPRSRHDDDHVEQHERPAEPSVGRRSSSTAAQRRSDSSGRCGRKADRPAPYHSSLQIEILLGLTFSAHNLRGTSLALTITVATPSCAKRHSLRCVAVFCWDAALPVWVE